MKDELVNAVSRGRDELINGLLNYIKKTPSSSVELTNKGRLILADESELLLVWYKQIFIQDGVLMVEYAWVSSNFDQEYNGYEVESGIEPIDVFSFDEICSMMENIK